MEKSVERLFSDTILREAAHRFQVDDEQYHKLGDFENYVYEVFCNHKPYVLRLTHSTHRKKEEILAELNWVNDLKGHGMTVAGAIESKSGSLVEEIRTEDSSFYVCMFDKVPGKAVKAQDDIFAPALFHLWGQTIGQMNHLAKEYTVGDHEPKRAAWSDDDLLDIRKYIPIDQTRVIQRADQLLEQLQQYSVDRDVYGLIHSDIHSGNFFVDQDQMYVFDFDDSCYHWYVSDVAIPLYYAVWFKYPDADLQTRSAFGQQFFTHFLKGYLSVSSLSQDWINRIPTFLKLRDIVLYSVLHKKWDLSNVSPKQEKLLQEIKTRIEQGQPIVALDYDHIYQRIHKG